MNNSPRSLCLVGVLAIALLLSACGSAQSRKAGYVAHGMRYFNAGNYDKARVEFSNAAQIDPRDANVRYLLGEVAEKKGDIRAALGQYQAAIDQDPKLQGARAALGRLYLYAGLPDKAMELAETGLAMAPGNAQLLTVRGGARAQLGSDAQALQDAQQAVQLAPSDDYAIALLTSLYRKQAQYDQAMRVVQAGLQRLPANVSLRAILADLEVAAHEPDAAEAQLKQIIALEPRVPVHRYQLAKFYLQQKNTDAAEKTLREVISNFPDSIEAKVQLADFLAAQRSHDAAVTQIGNFLASDPKNVALKLALGGLLVQVGQPDRAAQTFSDVIAHVSDDDPQGLTARDRLASLRLAKNDVAGASAQVAAVLKQNPRDNDALILRSQISLSRGDTMGAIEDLRSVLRDQPTAVPVMRMLASAYRDNGEIGLAEETLRGALQASPKDASSRFDLAQVLVGDGKADQAEALLEQLGKEEPANASVQEALYRAQAAQKHYDEARTTAQNIERIAPKQGLGFYLEGMIDETEQKPAVAAQEYQQALQLEPQAGEPLTSLIRLDLQRKQASAATARLDSVLTKYPSDAVANNLKADVLLTEGKTDEAIMTYERTIQIAPTWEPGYDGLALAQLKLTRNDDAIHTLQLGVSHVQGNSAPLLSELGNLYERLHRPADAISLYQGILDKNPKSIFAANNLAMLLVTYNQDSTSLARAQRLADQLASLSVPSVIDTRGWVKFKSGDFHAAESLLQEAVDKSPDAPELRYHLGMAQMRSGEPQAAEQNLESALRSTQPFVGMQDARAALAQLQKGTSSG